jgi:hypothetical protein
MKKSTMFKDFPNIELPACLIALGFEDYSYHNDACARAAIIIAGGRYLTVWCAEANQNDREYQDADQFIVCINDEDDNFLIGEMQGFETESSMLDCVTAQLADQHEALDRDNKCRAYGHDNCTDSTHD